MSCHPGHLLILDCEGGNNAMSKSHSIVTVAPRCAHGGDCGAALAASGSGTALQVGALFATALIFVTDGKASEAAVEALGRMLEARTRGRSP